MRVFSCKLGILISREELFPLRYEMGKKKKKGKYMHVLVKNIGNFYYLLDFTSAVIYFNEVSLPGTRYPV